MRRSVQCHRPFVPGPLLLAFGILFSPALADAQSPAVHAEEYLSPSEAVAEAVTAPRHRNVSLVNLGPEGRHFLHGEGVGHPSLADMARPHRNLGGLYVDHGANRERNLTVRGETRLVLVDWENGARTEVEIPESARASGAAWSPDGAGLAFLAHYPNETHLYVADVATGASRRLTSGPVLATRVTAPAWSGDGRFVHTVLVPEGRGVEPEPPTTPGAPMVRVTADDENRLRTFPTLLETPHDRELFEYHTTGRLARIDIETGQVETLGGPAMFEVVDPAPDGAHVRVRTTLQPLSYIVRFQSFGSTEEIWDARGERVAEIREEETDKGVQGGNDDGERRGVHWRPDGEGLGFLEREEREDEGEEDDKDENDRKDRLFQWRPPFGEEDLRLVYESENRILDVRYSQHGDILFLTEEDDGEEHLFAVFADTPEERHTIYRHDPDDRLDEPGSLLTKRGERGTLVVRTTLDGEHIFLEGTRYPEDPLEEAPAPFLDRVEIRTGEVSRLFESAPDAHERVMALLDDEAHRVLVSRETPTDVPNSYVRDLVSGDERRITENVDHTPDLTRARREVHRVTRADGVSFTTRIALPEDWDGEPLPAILWFYPREYEDQEAYDQVARTLDTNRFPSLGGRSAEIFLRAGYAVVQPDHPIIGSMDSVNDRYVPDLIANHIAVIDAMAGLGYIDRTRLALGGHSYGGFGTINAMVRTPFFRAGIAGAPNSNRLLTPMGFQRERRLLWESRESYLEMSPFLWAERLEGALLIYHGADDQNVGTFPDNSWRLFHALNGLGKTAALYMYPYEAHGPAAEETLLDMWARWVAWLDHYVRDADG